MEGPVTTQCVFGIIAVKLLAQGSETLLLISKGIRGNLCITSLARDAAVCCPDSIQPWRNLKWLLPIQSELTLYFEVSFPPEIFNLPFDFMWSSMGEHFLKALDFAHLKVSKLWNFLSGDSIVLQSFLPCFDHIFTAGFSTEVWQSVIEKLAKKGLWHVSTGGGSHTRKTYSFK